VADHVGGVDESALGTFDLDVVTDGEGGHVLGDIAGGVGLDEEVKEAGLMVTRDGSVGAEDVLVCAIWLRAAGGDGDVLADGEAEDGSGSGKGEAVAIQGSIS
jgi:hypothetical protein